MSSSTPLAASKRSSDEARARLTGLARVFNEDIMGFFALVALATALGPMVFEVSADVERALTVVEWVLVTTFAAEFLVHGAVAQDRRAWIRSPWRIVDAITVLGPVIALLPQVSDAARGSLMLRMLRVVRAVAFGTRAGAIAVRTPREVADTTRAAGPKVSVVGVDGNLPAVGSDWNNFLAWTRQPGASWFHVSNLDRPRFEELARASGVPDQELNGVFDESMHARLREGAQQTTLILQIPTGAEAGFPEVRRDRLLAVVSKEGILTATTGSFDPHASVADLAGRSLLPQFAFPARITCALLSVTRERNGFIARRFDEEARRLEILEGDKFFLRESFKLRREMSTAALDLWHVKNIVRALADGKTTLGGVNLKDERYLDDLLAETESLYETVNKNKEEVEGLIELNINFKSFEMNAFLKLLAIVSFLGLIPSVAGGLLGMNVAGNPWPVTLGQVAFGVVMAMATALYVFAVKGWLR